MDETTTYDEVSNDITTVNADNEITSEDSSESSGLGYALAGAGIAGVAFLAIKFGRKAFGKVSETAKEFAEFHKAKKAEKCVEVDGEEVKVEEVRDTKKASK